MQELAALRTNQDWLVVEIVAEPDVLVLQRGDTVRLNESGNAKARLRMRTGVVVGPSRVKGRVRVLWNGLKRPQLVQTARLQLAERETIETGGREVDIAIISDELEKIQNARFARHLKMPRERPPQFLHPGPSRKPRTRWLLDCALAVIIGLTAAGMTIAATYVFSRSAG